MEHSRASELTARGLALVALASGYCVAVSSERIFLAWIHSWHPDALFGAGSHSELYFLALFALALACVAFGWVKSILRAISTGLDPREEETLVRLSQAALAIRLEPRKYRKQTMQLGIAFLWVAVPLHWLASIVEGALSGVSQHPPPNPADYWIVPAGTVVSSLYMSWIRQRPQIPVTHSKGEPGAYSGLILFLSNPLFSPLIQGEPKKQPLQQAGRLSWPEYKRQLRETTLDWTEKQGRERNYKTLVEEMKSKFGRNSWMMPTLSIAHQAIQGRLQRVVIIPSELEGEVDAERWTFNSGTARMVPVFREWIQRSIDSAVRIDALPESGVSFNSPQELAKAIEDAYKLLRETHGVQEVIVDLTGGTKECSLAAALQSVPVGRVVMYLDNNDYTPRQHDITLPEHLEGAYHGP